MKNLIVCKYGGSSITKPEDVDRIKYITDDNPERKIIVVSAPGKRDKNDTKVTDMLIELAKTRDESLVDKIIERYHTLIPDVNLSEIKGMLESRLYSNLPKDQYLDSLKAFGEEACARIMAEKIGAEYIDPKKFFVVSNKYSNAEIMPSSLELINARFSSDNKFIVPGFFGYTKDSMIATFSRGGSDLTGSYIAAALNAKVYENFTDTDGIFAADPRIIINPKKIETITYNEIRDLAYSGFSIFHDEAIRPARDGKLTIHVRNTFNYPTIGTNIVYERISDPAKPIIGVAYKNGFCSFDIALFGLNKMIGAGSAMWDIFGKKEVSVEYVTTGIDDMSIIIGSDQLKDSPNLIGELSADLSSLLGKDAEINFEEGLGSLVVAGKGMKGKKGLSAKVQMVLADADVNIKFISQGPLERCIIYGIPCEDSNKAVNAVYDVFIK